MGAVAIHLVRIPHRQCHMVASNFLSSIESREGLCLDWLFHVHALAFVSIHLKLLTFLFF